MILVISSALIALNAKQPRWLVLLITLFVITLIGSSWVPAEPLYSWLIKLCLSFVLLIVCGVLGRRMSLLAKRKLNIALAIILTVLIVGASCFAYIGHETVKGRPLEQFMISRPVQVYLLAGSNLSFSAGELVAIRETFPSKSFEQSDIPKKLFDIPDMYVADLLAASSLEEVFLNYAQITQMIKARDMINTSPRFLALAVTWMFDF